MREAFITALQSGAVFLVVAATALAVASWWYGAWVWLLVNLALMAANTAIWLWLEHVRVMWRVIERAHGGSGV